jgi:hypothetical protein
VVIELMFEHLMLFRPPPDGDDLVVERLGTRLMAQPADADVSRV